MLNKEVKHSVEATYSPSAILNAFSNSLTSPLLNEQIKIKGIYRRGKGVNYNGFYYDVLKDLSSEANVTIVVPEAYRLRLNDGHIVEASVYTTKRLSSTTSRIDLILNVVEIISHVNKVLDSSELELLEVVREKAQIGYRDTDSFIKKKILVQQPITVVILVGISAIIDADIKHQLKEAEKVFDISFVKINLTRIEDIITGVKQYDGCDILIIARGGGERLEVFNSASLCKECLHLKSILITAIGHAVDETALQKIADKHFITPTALGQYFHDIYNGTIEDLNNSKAEVISRISAQFETQYSGIVQELNRRISRQDAESKEAAQLQKDQQEKLNKRLSKSNMLAIISFTIAAILTLVLAYMLTKSG